MRINVRLFAGARQLAGKDAVELELPEPSSVQVLRRRLLEEVPDLGPLAQHLVFAVQQEYANDETLIVPGAEVACIPPVSGG